MLAKVCSSAVNGIDAYPVEVEVNAGFGDTIIVIVGLPDAAVKESRDRVMTITSAGIHFTFPVNIHRGRDFTSSAAFWPSFTCARNRPELNTSICLKLTLADFAGG